MALQIILVDMESRMSNKKTGRPRDESIRKRILETAVKILMKKGYRETTMKDIAREAQVSKQTLYRWWKNRAELLMEAFAENAEKTVLFPDTESNIFNLEEFLKNTFRTSDNKTRALLKTLLAESISDRNFGEVSFNNFIKKRQAFLSEKLKHLSEFESEKDKRIDSIVDIIFGTLWYRILFDHRPLDNAFARELTEIILKKSQ